MRLERLDTAHGYGNVGHVKQNAGEGPMKQGFDAFIPPDLINAIKHVPVVLIAATASTNFTGTHYLHAKFCHVQGVCQGAGTGTGKHTAKHRLEKPYVGLSLTLLCRALEVTFGVVLNHHAFEMLVKHKVEG